MPTRNVNLTDHYDHFVTSLIGSGRYKNASEVMRAGLRLLEHQGREDEEKLAALRGLAAEAFDALDRGDGIAIEGEKQLADFIGRIGRRAAKRVNGRSSDK
jgi:antitoxin ParD1/3/4